MDRLRLFLAQVDLSPLPHHAAADNNDIQKLLTIIFSVFGAIAVIIVVIGGIKYASSQGDPQSTARAKDTIIYAIVGLVICILAVSIVQFVIGGV